MKPKFILIIYLLVMVVGCNLFHTDRLNQTLSTKSIIGNWQLYDLSNNNSDEKDGDDNLLKTAKSKEVIKEGKMLSLFEDGTYTDIGGNGNYTTGKWEYDEEKKVLRFNNSTRFSTVPVKEEIINDQQTIDLSNYSQGQQLKFIRVNKPLKDFHEDPFYFKNNAWRIKPGTKETTAQLEERLANYFRHLAYILKAANERKQNVVTFQFSLGIVKIYNGGIGIYPLTIIPKTWMDTYYDNADATSAYYLFRNYLMNHSYGGAGIGKWIEDDYNILLSIYADAERGQICYFSYRKLRNIILI